MDFMDRLAILGVLFLFGSCTACMVIDEQDRQRCIPQCGEYFYTGKTQNGQCVCDMSKVKR